MARLLRLHFASIGHGDARLDPLHLDFRGDHNDSKQAGPAGVDSVVWLRNGGGKSSIINLFFSVFRPSAREFLGSSAEGKARRLEQYIRGHDLGFVVSEWASGQPGDRRAGHRIVGQVLAWKNHRPSTDIANLRRLFFSLRVQPEQVALEDLPVPGLGGRSASFEGFRQWLTQTSQSFPDAEVVSTANQRQWAEHLERIGIDPEVFRYQLAMNQREGAADELFRFRNDAEFIEFLLEMVSDPAAANQVVRNMAAQQENLEQRPRWLLERAYLEQAVSGMEAFVAATRAREDAEQNLWEATTSMSTMAVALERSASEYREAAERDREAAELGRIRVRNLSNERDKFRRWAAGLERAALQLDLRDAKAAAQACQQRLAGLEHKGRVLDATGSYLRLRAHQAKIAELEALAAREHAEREPLRRALRDRGSWLRAALAELLAAAQTQLQGMQADLNDLEARRRQGQKAGQEARARAVHARAEIKHLDTRIRERDRAREGLVKLDSLEARESVADALARWGTRIDELEAQRVALEQASLESQEALNDRLEHRQRSGAEHARLKLEAERLSSALEAGLRWRDQLAEDKILQEIEEDSPANPESPGLVDRLNARVGHFRTSALASEVQGAEDRRSLAHLADNGLLPSPLDVSRVLEQLATANITAVTGGDYLAQNTEPEHARKLLAADPARFSGVILVDELAEGTLEDFDWPDLHGPVQISTITGLMPEAGPDAAYIALPHPALYDADSAAGKRGSLETAVAQQAERVRSAFDREQQLRDTAAKLQRFLDAHGQGQLERLQEDTEQCQRRCEHAQAELERAENDIRDLRRKLVELDQQGHEAREQLRSAGAHLVRVQNFSDNHESQLPGHRAARDQQKQQLAEAERVVIQVEHDLGQCEAEIAEQNQRIFARRTELANLEQERDAVEYFEEPAVSEAPEAMGLAQLRAAYQTHAAHYAKELSESRAQAEFELLRDQLPEFQREFRSASRGLEDHEIAQTAERNDLEDYRREHDLALARERETDAECRAAQLSAQRALDERPSRRREAEDLPPEHSQPDNAEQARQAAVAYRESAEATLVEIQEEEEQTKRSEQSATAKLANAERCSTQRQRLLDAARIGQCSLLPVSGHERTIELGRLVEEVDQIALEFAQRHEQAQAAHRQRETVTERVHRIAHDHRYAELRARYQEQMKQSSDDLAEVAGDLVSGLSARADIVAQSLAKLDEDRQLIVEELLHLADQTARILTRAQHASALPAGFQGWSGKPYLRIGFSFPDNDDERRGRLEPFVDRVIERGQIPSGLQLMFHTALELAGARGFDVRILKPDTVLRPEPIALHLMSTFSRGQQLTAAILMYCTLVHLRASARGRAHLRADAGLLLLDNPLGTCSNVGLLQLQRRVAERMGVQLVYTTGIEDLEALATLPNKIRLVNEHRDRRTGDRHVTADDDDDEKPESSMRVARLHDHHGDRPSTHG